MNRLILGFTVKVSQEWSGNSSLLWCSDLKPTIDVVKA